MKSSFVYPTFLYIGTSKAGSSWIFEMLREHPEIYVPVAKDLRFFEEEIFDPEKFDRYLNFFKGGRGFKSVGELSHNYILSSITAKNIKSCLPEIKILACLREPGDWIKSSFGYSRLFLETAENFQIYLESHVKLRRILEYYQNLIPYYQHFPSDHIQVLFYEDLKNNPGGYLSELYGFLGVDSGFRPENTSTKVNPARSSRFGKRFSRMLYRFAQVTRNYGLENILGYIKRNPIVNRVLFSQEREDLPIPSKILQEIRSESGKSYSDLENLIGRKLPQEWFERLQKL